MKTKYKICLMSVWHIFSFSFPLKTLCSLALCVFFGGVLCRTDGGSNDFYAFRQFLGAANTVFANFSTVVVISKFGFTGGDKEQRNDLNSNFEAYFIFFPWR